MDTLDAVESELGRHLSPLLVATRLWSLKREFDEEAVISARHQALLLNHDRYVSLIPAYRKMAQAAGLSRVTNIDQIATELTVTTDLFKSYDPMWLKSGDFQAMTDWLTTVFVRAPAIDAGTTQSLDDWRRRLRADQVYLHYSSGTSGRLSFVPRDVMTLTALRQNGRCYSHPILGAVDRWEGDFDCLILGPRGVGSGLQAVATGLAAAATRSHHLYQAELTAGMVFARTVGDDGLAAAAIGHTTITLGDEDRESSYARGMSFLEQAAGEGRRVLVFGPPFEVDELCRRLLDASKPLALGVGSAVVTGGGWKAVPERSREVLNERVERALGIERSHIVDVYSTAELNAALLSCTENRYHVPPLLEPMAVDDLLVPLQGDDVSGTLAFLDPFAFSYPGFVITGDEGRLVRGECRCGITGWSIVGPIRRPVRAGQKGCAGLASSVRA